MSQMGLGRVAEGGEGGGLGRRLGGCGAPQRAAAPTAIHVRLQDGPPCEDTSLIMIVIVAAHSDLIPVARFAHGCRLVPLAL